MLGVRVLEEKNMSITHAISHEISKDRVINVLQSIALKQQTGRLSIEHVGESGNEKGEIFFISGDTVFARTPHLSGETALDQILNWKEISYSFVEETPAPAPTQLPTNRRGRSLSHIPHTNPRLPIEMQKTCEIPVISLGTNSATIAPIRQTPAIGMPTIPRSVRPIKESIPETPSLSRSIVNISSIPDPQRMPAVILQVSQQGTTLAGNGDAENMHQLGVYAVFRSLPIATTREVIYRTERRDRIVLLLLNGRRTLREVAQLIHRSELDVARALLRLLKQDYIEYCGYYGFGGY